jgi:hypothetical protein
MLKEPPKNRIIQAHTATLLYAKCVHCATTIRGKGGGERRGGERWA